MTTITISHSHAEGTLIEGSRKGDGVWEILLELRRCGQGNWRFSRGTGLYLGQSRDKPAQQWKIDKAAEALRAAGFDVDVEVSEGESRPFAEIEADRYDRAGERADRYADRSAGAVAAGERMWDETSEVYGALNGTPVLVGHHSEQRHRNLLARTEAKAHRAVDELKRGRYWEQRAAAAERFKDHRESVPVTLRRIEKLEADLRRVQRDIDGVNAPGRYQWEKSPASGAGLARLEQQKAGIAGELDYWREHVAARQAEGVKIWGRADFTKGDYVHNGHGWYQVERVNPKSLSVPTGNNDHLLKVVTRATVTHAMGPSQWTSKVTYDQVRGRKTAAEMAAALGAAETEQGTAS